MACEKDSLTYVLGKVLTAKDNAQCEIRITLFSIVTEGTSKQLNACLGKCLTFSVHKTLKVPVV